jgi:hypothetical protein
MVPWLQRICEHASKVEDKTLPLLAQHWARISRTIQSKLQAFFFQAIVITFSVINPNFQRI